ncbi:hypothetical protein B296_00020269 [Ensete ventricosum]|uniref:Uncharacterized protein n=1 Tax=Ensete ventricosum TaxID=4639 RepID=A0A427A850_ENSVE|nr:hypothetical protein B296_00020269 [Ensete ventricosum]
MGANSGSSPCDLAEGSNSGTNLRDLAERVNSGTNLRDLSERANSSTDLGDLTDRVNSGTNLGVGLGDPEANPSGASSGPPSPVDARVLRDLEVTKADHDLNTAVTERSLVIRERYNIPVEYGFHVPRSGQRPYSSNAPGVKILSRSHKSRHDEGGSRSHSKGKEPAEPIEEPKTLGDSTKEDAPPVFHRPRSMKDLFKTKVYKDDAGYYALHMSNLAHQDPEKEMQPRWEGLKNSTKVWNDPSAVEEFKRGLLHPQLAWEPYTLPSEVLLARAAKEMVMEIDALKSEGGPKAVAKAEKRASELEKELEKTKCERDEALQRLEASNKELNEVRSNLFEIQRLLQEALVKAR